jgi:hypothetical protein
VFMNHELEPSVAPNSYSRISHLTLDRKTRSVLDASYAFTGAEGFSRFCSATLEVLQGTPWFFTGEEDLPTLGHDGSSIALNAATGDWTETKHFGHVLHENVVPIERLSKAFFLTTDDDFRDPPAFNAYLYAYIAKTWDGAISGTEGSLYVWKANGAADSSKKRLSSRRTETPSTAVRSGPCSAGRMTPATVVSWSTTSRAAASRRSPAPTRRRLCGRASGNRRASSTPRRSLARGGG